MNTRLLAISILSILFVLLYFKLPEQQQSSYQPVKYTFKAYYHKTYAKVNFLVYNKGEKLRLNNLVYEELNDGTK